MALGPTEEHRTQPEGAQLLPLKGKLEAKQHATANQATRYR
jgi:hypothetical protein